MFDRLIMAGTFTAACFIGLVFLVAAVSKWRSRDLLPGVIANYRLLPAALVAPASLALPVAELVTGAALIAGERRFAPWAAMALLAVFAAAMAINLRRGRREIDCGCGRSALRQPLGWHLVARNVLLIMLLLPSAFVGSDLAGGDLPAALAGGVLLYLVYELFHAIGALGRSAAHLHAHQG